MPLSRIILSACLRVFGVLSLVVAALALALAGKSSLIDANSALAAKALGLAAIFAVLGLFARWAGRRVEMQG